MTTSATGPEAAPLQLDVVDMYDRSVVGDDRIRLEAWQEVALSELITRGREASLALAENGNTVEAERRYSLRQAAREGEMAFMVFFNANLGLVYSQADFVIRRATDLVDMDDLIQVGKAELAECILRFDPSLGNKFGSFALERIRFLMFNWAKENGRIIKVGRSTRDKLARYERFVNSGMATEDAAEEAGVSLETLQAARAALDGPDAISLDRPLTSDPNSGSLADILMPDVQSYESPFGSDDSMDIALVIDAIRAVVKARADAPYQTGIDPERGFKVLMGVYAYGLLQNELATQLGVSKERIRQIIAVAVDKIHKKLPDYERKLVANLGYGSKAKAATKPTATP